MTATPTVALRPVQPDDRGFLLEVYAATRTEELAGLEWDPATRDAFLTMQFTAQHADYRRRHPDGEFCVIEVDGHPAGRLYLSRTPEGVRIVDLALLPAHRGLGVGTRLVTDVLRAADASGDAVSLHVERGNRARALYERLGFRVVGSSDVHLLLERPPVSQLNTAS